MVLMHLKEQTQIFITQLLQQEGKGSKREAFPEKGKSK